MQNNYWSHQSSDSLLGAGPWGAVNSLLQYIDLFIYLTS